MDLLTLSSEDLDLLLPCLLDWLLLLVGDLDLFRSLAPCLLDWLLMLGDLELFLFCL